MVLRLSGKADVHADRAKVWDALHDTSCLKLCIPGCVAIERVSPERFELSVRVGMGPFGMAVGGAVLIQESEPQRLLCLRAKGSAGTAWIVGGHLRMTLLDSPAGCRIAYVGEVEPKGGFVVFGNGFLAKRANRLVDRFVATFAAAVRVPSTVRTALPRPNVHERETTS